MEQLGQILRDATAAINHEYFLLPIDGADAVCRTYDDLVRLARKKLAV